MPPASPPYPNHEKDCEMCERATPDVISHNSPGTIRPRFPATPSFPLGVLGVSLSANSLLPFSRPRLLWVAVGDLGDGGRPTLGPDGSELDICSEMDPRSVAARKQKQKHTLDTHTAQEYTMGAPPSFEGRSVTNWDQALFVGKAGENRLSRTTHANCTPDQAFKWAIRPYFSIYTVYIYAVKIKPCKRQHDPQDIGRGPY